MSRLPLAVALTVFIPLISACEGKQDAAPAATPVQPSTAATTPTAPTPEAPASSTPTASPPASEPAQTTADAGSAEDPDTAVGAAAPVDPADLAGQYAFGWSGGKTAKCKKIDKTMLKKLAGKDVMCRHRDPSQAFAEGAGLWSTCQVGEAEWVIFTTKAICQEQLETMEANAP